MDERQLFHQKQEAQLKEWQAYFDKLKAKAEEASADTQLALKKELDVLKEKIHDGSARLRELSDAGDDAWDTAKQRVESAWHSLRSAVHDATSKFDV